MGYGGVGNGVAVGKGSLAVATVVVDGWVGCNGGVVGVGWWSLQMIDDAPSFQATSTSRSFP